MSKLRIFVTGGTGFIGSHFVNQALSAGHHVIGNRRTKKSSSGTAIPSPPRVPINPVRYWYDSTLRKYLCPEEMRFIYAQNHSVIDAMLAKEPDGSASVDLLKSGQLVWLDKSIDQLSHKDFEGCDVVVHLAAHSMHLPHDSLRNCLYWNVLVPTTALSHAIEVGVNRFVIAGSCFEYGLAGENCEYIPTTTRLEPTQAYSASKAAASIAFLQMAYEFRLRLSVHRIFHAFGEGEASTRLWPSIRSKAFSGEDLLMTEGLQVRDFIPGELVAAELLRSCSRTDLLPGAPIIENLGSKNPQTVRQFAEEWWRRWKAKGAIQFGKLPYRKGEVMRYVPEISVSISSSSE